MVPGNEKVENSIDLIVLKFVEDCIDLLQSRDVHSNLLALSRLLFTRGVGLVLDRLDDIDGFFRHVKLLGLDH
jgi:hypothetical protein